MMPTHAGCFAKVDELNEEIQRLQSELAETKKELEITRLANKDMQKGLHEKNERVGVLEETIRTMGKVPSVIVSQYHGTVEETPIDTFTAYRIERMLMQWQRKALEDSHPKDCGCYHCRPIV